MASRKQVLLTLLLCALAAGCLVWGVEALAAEAEQNYEAEGAIRARIPLDDEGSWIVVMPEETVGPSYATERDASDDESPFETCRSGANGGVTSNDDSNPEEQRH